MTTFGDTAPLASFGDITTGREPGAELPFPACPCPAPPLGVDAIRFLTEVDLAVVVDAARAACLHRCPGWPARRREP